VPHDEVLLIDEGQIQQPAQSFGMDSNWILRVLMGADDQDVEVLHKLDRVFKLIAQKNLAEAEATVQQLRQQTGNSEAIQRAASTIERMRILGK